MNTNSARLKHALDAEVLLTEKLYQLVQEEHQALRQQNFDGLVASSEQKQGCIVELEEQAKTRSKMLQEADLDLDKEGMQSLIRQCDPDGSSGIARLWARLHRLLSDCHHLNRVNSHVVQTRLHYSRQTMALLRGQPPGTTQQYAANGQAIHSLNGTTLANA